MKNQLDLSTNELIPMVNQDKNNNGHQPLDVLKMLSGPETFLEKLRKYYLQANTHAC